jgi:hypothetical protein
VKDGKKRKEEEQKIGLECNKQGRVYEQIVPQKIVSSINYLIEKELRIIARLIIENNMTKACYHLGMLTHGCKIAVCDDDDEKE